jgi:hypothetical protein
MRNSSQRWNGLVRHHQKQSRLLFFSEQLIVDSYYWLRRGDFSSNRISDFVLNPFHPNGATGVTERRCFGATSTTGSTSEQRLEQENPVVDNNRNSFENIGRLELDFFGEPVTFVERVSPIVTINKKNSNKVVSSAMAALDGFLLTVISKGLTCSDGGEEGGIEIRSAHATAVSWSELLRYATIWNENNENNIKKDDNGHTKSAPMLAVVAIAPILIQTSLAYIKHLDTLLKQTKPPAPGVPVVQMYELAKTVVACKDDNHLNPRERWHLQALHHLLQEEYPTALAIYVRLLRSCPGDALALSLTMDLCQVLGDKKTALK